MEVLLSIIGIIFCLLLYVNIKVTSDIKQSSSATQSEKKRAILVVWCIPFLGVLFVSKKGLPYFYKDTSGNSYTKESGGGFPGGS
jgi:heme/copper-type cytochrome/quinol oxidase subunit 2